MVLTPLKGEIEDFLEVAPRGSILNALGSGQHLHQPIYKIVSVHFQELFSEAIMIPILELTGKALSSSAKSLTHSTLFKPNPGISNKYALQMQKCSHGS